MRRPREVFRFLSRSGFADGVKLHSCMVRYCPSEGKYWAVWSVPTGIIRAHLEDSIMSANDRPQDSFTGRQTATAEVFLIELMSNA